MSVRISFQFDTAAEAAQFLLSVEGQVAGSEPRPFERPIPTMEDAVAAGDAIVAKKTRAKKGKPVEAAPAVEPTKPIGLDDLRAAMSGLLGRKGMPACDAVLKQYGIKRLAELPVEKYAAYVADCAK